MASSNSQDGRYLLVEGFSIQEVDIAAGTLIVQEHSSHSRLPDGAFHAIQFIPQLARPGPTSPIIYEFDGQHTGNNLAHTLRPAGQQDLRPNYYALLSHYFEAELESVVHRNQAGDGCRLVRNNYDREAVDRVTRRSERVRAALAAAAARSRTTQTGNPTQSAESSPLSSVPDSFSGVEGRENEEQGGAGIKVTVTEPMETDVTEPVEAKASELTKPLETQASEAKETPDSPLEAPTSFIDELHHLKQ